MGQTTNIPIMGGKIKEYAAYANRTKLPVSPGLQQVVLLLLSSRKKRLTEAPRSTYLPRYLR